MGGEFTYPNMGSQNGFEPWPCLCPSDGVFPTDGLLLLQLLEEVIGIGLLQVLAMDELPEPARAGWKLVVFFFPPWGGTPFFGG